MSLKEEDCISDLSGVDSKQQQVLDDWVNYFVYRKKYPVVGVVPRIRPKWDPADLPASKFSEDTKSSLSEETQSSQDSIK